MPTEEAAEIQDEDAEKIVLLEVLMREAKKILTNSDYHRKIYDDGSFFQDRIHQYYREYAGCNADNTQRLRQVGVRVLDDGNDR